MYVVILLFCLAVVSLMMILFMLVSVKICKNENNESTYECGFDSSFSVRKAFSYRFFLIVIIFLIFDVEITLLLPVPYIVMTSLMFKSSLIFMGLLLTGLVYEMVWGSLDWLFEWSHSPS